MAQKCDASRRLLPAKLFKGRAHHSVARNQHAEIVVPIGGQQFHEVSQQCQVLFRGQAAGI
jgi:hypothetical protein